MSDLVDTLSRVPLFEALQPSDLAHLAEVGRLEYWQAGSIVLEEGTMGPRMMVVLSGEVEILRRDQTGVQRAIATLGAGEILGELGLLLDLPRTATVRALAPLQVFAMDRTAFQELVDASDPAALRLGLSLSRVLAVRLMKLNDRVVELLAAGESATRERFRDARQQIFNLWDEP
jgi:CRP/FNR family cyclic AMP-dependent transcriptional regulator